MNAASIKKIGAPTIPDNKKRKHGYVLNLDSADKDAIEQIARERHMKPAEIYHEAARLFMEEGPGRHASGKTVDVPQEQGKPDMASTYLNLSAEEKGAILQFGTATKMTTIADVFRTAVKLYIKNAGF